MSEYEDEDARTLFCANISDKVTEALLFELFLQGGPVEKVAQPKDKDGRARTFAFITYVSFFGLIGGPSETDIMSNHVYIYRCMLSPFPMLSLCFKELSYSIGNLL